MASGTREATAAPRLRREVAVAQVLAAAALWGVNGVVARSLFRRDVDPAHLVQVRMLVGGLALVPLSLARGTARLAAPSWPGVLAYALVLATVQLTYFEAIATAGVAVAIFLQYTSPLLVAAWEAARARRLPPPLVLAALVLATGGSALLVLPQSGGARVPPAGFAWGFASALGMSASTLLGGALRRRGAHATPLLAWGLVIGSLAFTPLRSPWGALASVPPADWPYFAYVAIFATAAPFTLYASALLALRGSVAMLLAMLEPVLATGLAWVVLGEALSPFQLAGGALILVAVAAAARAR